MSTSYSLVETASNERKLRHREQVQLYIAGITKLAKETFTEIDEWNEDELECEIRRLELQLDYLVNAHEIEVCTCGRATNWRINKQEFDEHYRTGKHQLMDEYGEEYTLEQFIEKVGKMR